MLVSIEYPRLFEEFVDEFFGTEMLAAAFPVMDMVEYDKEYVLVAEMPGVRKEDTHISVEDGVLTLKGERRPYEIPEDAHVILNEIRVRGFRRTVQLPDDVDTNGITAELENGVLRVVMPKREEARPRMIEIR